MNAPSTENRDRNPSATPDPGVSDPHPGSVSDGTHPEADEVKLPRGRDEESRKMTTQTESPAVQSLQQEQDKQKKKAGKGELQEGLEDTFPASDPVSATNPAVTNVHADPQDAVKE